MPELGRGLIVLGALALVVGVVLVVLPRLPGLSWIGRLPGDLVIERPGLKVHIPLATCLVVSAILTLLLYVLRR
jgi:hypothetical protein